MDALQYDPLDFYKGRLEKTHKENVEACFGELTEKSGINIEENRKTVASYKSLLKKLDKLKNKRFWLKFLRVVMWILAIVSVVASIALAGEYPYLLLICLPISALLIVLIFLKLTPTIRGMDSTISEKEREASALRAKAEMQMSPLNSLFTREMTLELFEKSFPNFHFSKHFTEELSRELRDCYDMAEYNDNEISVIDTLAGRYNENPFVYLRRKKHTMGTQIYHGYRTISWRETYRDSDGKTRTRIRTQTLHAQVVKPKPYYSIDTRLHFGADGAPNLTFSREGHNINLKSDKAIARIVKRGEKAIKKKSAKALGKGGGFTAMTNSEFDVLFNATNRDNEMEFRLMFTPLAQTNLVELILSDDTFGDDFDFYKFCKHNIIITDHAQNWNMDTSPENYISYSYDEAKQKFENFNNGYLKSVYFDFAPLLAIPVYQESVKALKADIQSSRQSLANEEYEAMANAIGVANFSHGDTHTDTILKAYFENKSNGEEEITVNAYSYTTENRMDFIPVLGGDGNMHVVSVPWVEYIPLVRTSRMYSRELCEADKEKENPLSAVRNKILSYIK